MPNASAGSVNKVFVNLTVFSTITSQKKLMALAVMKVINAIVEIALLANALTVSSPIILSFRKNPSTVQ